MMCSRDDPTRQCPDRRLAVRQGRFFFAWNAGAGGAWIWRKARTNPWTMCPWCGGDLPTLEDAVRRTLDGTAECWDGEDE